MSGPLRIVRIVFWLALVLWTSAVISGGVAAAAVFSILPDLGVHLDTFAAYPDSDHGRIAAGLIMEPVFTGIDIAQFTLAAVVLVAVIAEFIMAGVRDRRTSNLLRMLGVAAAIGTLGWRVAMIMPEMNRDLRAYRAAAEVGDVDTANAHRSAFDDAHPLAQRFMEFTLIGLFITICASAAGGSPHQKQKAESELEPPALLQRGAS